MTSLPPKMLRAIRKHLNSKDAQNCLYVDSNGRRCSNLAVASHSVQKGRVLSSIAEKGHVYQIQGPGEPYSSSEFSFEKVGIRKASVFPGFCSQHDSQIFSPVETGNSSIDLQSSMILGYRSVCHELHKKNVAIKLRTSPEYLQAIFEEAPHMLREAGIQLQGSQRGQADHARSKATYEKALHSGKLVGAYGAVVEFDQTLPFAFSGVFAPEFTFSGKRILPEIFEDWNNIGMFCGSINSRNIFGFFGFDDTKYHPLRSFFESMQTVHDDKWSDIALAMAVEYCENTYFRKSWIDGLSGNIRAKLLKRTGEGMPADLNTHKQHIQSQFHVVGAKVKQRHLYFSTDSA